MKQDLLLKRLLPHLPGVVFLQRCDGSLEYCGPNFQKLTGVACEAARNPAWFWELVHEADHDGLRRQISRCAETGAEGVSSVFRIRHPQTGWIHHIAEFRMACLNPAGQIEGYEGYWLDVTRQKHLENRFVSLLWKDTLGTVALGFAHDFNNLLTGILSLSEAYLMQMDAANPVCEGLALIKNNAHQASQLVQRLAHLYQSQSGSCGYQDLNTTTADTVALLRRVISRRIDLASEFSAAALPLYVDAVRLRQATIALAFHAVEAIGDRGRILFQTSRQEQWPAPGTQDGSAPPKPAVRLSVRYEGSEASPCPKDASALGQTFGLGLAQARQFAGKYSGAMTVESSAAEAATTLHLWLPESDFTEAELTYQARARARSILLAGRDSGGLARVAKALREGGHHVVLGGDDAIELLLSDDYQFDALLVQAGPNQAEAWTLLALARKLKLPLKTVAQVASHTLESLAPMVLPKADLILPDDLSDAELANKIRSLWA